MIVALDLEDIQPPLPDLGSPVVGLSMSVDHDVQIYETLKPLRPSREVWEYTDYDDDAAPVYVRDLTDEEYEAAIDRWRATVKEWERTNGRISTRGPMRYECDVELEDGSRVKLIGDGKTRAIVAETRVTEAKR